MIRRRVLLISLAGVIAAPIAAAAQPAKKIARIGFLSPSSLSDPRTRSFVEAFRQGLRDLGWVEGQNVTIEYRWAEERTERLAELAGDLARPQHRCARGGDEPGHSGCEARDQNHPDRHDERW